MKYYKIKSIILKQYTKIQSHYLSTVVDFNLSFHKNLDHLVSKEKAKQEKKQLEKINCNKSGKAAIKI